MKVRHAIWGALLGGAALGYWAPHHMDMNGQILMEGHPFGEDGFKAGTRPVLTVDDYLRKVLFINDGQKKVLAGVAFKSADLNPGQDQPDDAPHRIMSILNWNRHGGLWEDGFENFTEGMKWGGLRAVNHFHDPLTGSGGYTGINRNIPDVGTGVPFVDLFRKGISATQWVQNGTSGGRRNAWGYPTVGEQMLKFYREQDPVKRDARLANVFRALGQVEHLIEDNTVPDHTRDLLHPGRGFEEYVKDRVMGTSSKKGGSTLLSAFPYAEWKFLPLKTVEAEGFRAIWDRDVYTGDGASPRPTRSLSTLRSLRHRSPRKTRYRPAGFALAGRVCPAGLVPQVSELCHSLLLPRQASWRTVPPLRRDPGVLAENCV